MSDPRRLQQRVRDLSAAVQSDPSSVARRLELAAALRDLGRAGEAVELYRGVALLYAEEGRFAQAIAVCRGILEIEPRHGETQTLLADIAARRSEYKTTTPQVELLGFEENTPLPAPRPPPPPTMPLGSLSGSRPRSSPPRAPSSVPPPAPPAGEPSAPPPAPDQPPDFDERTKVPSGDEPLPSFRGAAAPPGGENDTIQIPVGGLFPDGVLDEHTSPQVPAAARVPQEPLDFDEETALQGALHLPMPPPDTATPVPPFPLLGDLPRAALAELIGRLRVRHERAGAWLVREGEPGDACYLIASGRVRVVKGGIEVAQLGAGSFFGEFAVLADQRRHASVEVAEDVELLEISRQLLDRLTAAHPGVARTLRRFYRQRLMATLVATAPFFAPLTELERVAVAQRFRPRRFGRGGAIIEQGAAGGGLYLILVGEVEVVRVDEAGAEIRLASLGEGSYFGEMSLLRGGDSSATVRATRTTEAVQLSPRDFYEVTSQHPVLWDTLRTEAARRELLNQGILAGEARKSGEGIYLL